MAQFLGRGLAECANTTDEPFHRSRPFLVVRRPLFHIAKTERETNIQPNRVADNAQVGSESLCNWEQSCSFS